MSRAIFGGSLILLCLVARQRAHAELPVKLNLGSKQLVLNGEGNRTKYLMEMYQVGLYVPELTENAEQILGSGEPVALRLVITSGFVSQEKMVTSLNEGFEKSTRGRQGQFIAEIEQFRRSFADPITKGDTFDIVYLPAQGVVVLKNGQFKGQVPGLAFKRAVFGIWLGEEPADEDLRVALLGAGRR